MPKRKPEPAVCDDAALKRLKAAGITYPWSPWQCLTLLDRIDAGKRRLERLIADLEADGNSTALVAILQLEKVLRDLDGEPT